MVKKIKILVSWRALVALGEEAKGVNLANEVDRARPSAEAEADDEHPRDDEAVGGERPGPAAERARRRLDGVLPGGRRRERRHVRHRRDDVDGEADEEGSDGGVDGAEEGEDDGEEPDGEHDGEPRRRAAEHAGAAVDADGLLPHEVERRAGEAEGDELVDEHEHHRGVAPRRPRQQREGVGVVQQRVPERPVHRRRRRQRQRQHVRRRGEVDHLEPPRPPHGVHDLHRHGVAAERVEDVGGTGEVEHHRLARPGARRRPIHLAVHDGGDGEVPRGVGRHEEAEEGPDAVVVEGRDEHRGGAASPEDVGPCPLVEAVVDVVDVAGAGDELDDGAEEEEGAVEEEAGVAPMAAEEAVEHLEPLDDMVAEVHLVALPPRPVLDVEHADEVGRPRPHQPVEHLERHPGRHAQLREGVGQRQQHLRHLHRITPLMTSRSIVVIAMRVSCHVI